MKNLIKPIDETKPAKDIVARNGYTVFPGSFLFYFSVLYLGLACDHGRQQQQQRLDAMKRFCICRP